MERGCLVFKMAVKVVIFGIDGASWNILGPIMEKGWMPNLARLVEKYGKGILQSSLPPQTYPAWINFTTGANPGKHSCFSLKKHTSYTNFKLISGSDKKVKPFYSWLDKAGKKCVLINLPGAFPLQLKNGKGLATFLDQNRLYYPESLRRLIPEVVNYQTFPDYISASIGLTNSVKEFLKLEKQRFLLAKKLFGGDWDFYFYLVSAYDFLFHKLGRGRNLAEILKVRGVREFFKEIDKQLGWLVKRAKGCQFMLMSDHGFKEYRYTFFINAWLRKNGYLKLKRMNLESKEKMPSRLKLLKEDAKKLNQIFAQIIQLMDKYPNIYGWLGWLVRNFPFLFSRLSEVRLGDLGLEEDKLETKAYVPDGVFLYSQLGKREMGRLISQLKALRLLDSDKKALADVHLSADVYEGPWLKDLPPVVLEWGEALVDCSLWSKKILVRRKNMNHQSEGVFLTFGPKLTVGVEDKIKIEDLAPTILKLFNQKIPKYMDGKPMV